MAVQVVQHDARLDPGPLLLLIDLDDLVQVLAEIGDDGVVHRLPGQAGPAGAGQHRHAALLGYFDHGQDVFHVPGDHHAHRLHLVDAGVGAVEHTGERVELHFT